MKSSGLTLVPGFLLELGFLFLIGSSPALAQSLSLTVEADQVRLRSQAPLRLELILRWDGSRILEGHVELAVADRGIGSQAPFVPIAHFRSRDVALPTGDFRLGVLLPWQRLTNSDGLMVLRARFVADDDGRAIELGEHDILLLNQQQRRLGIAVVVPDSLLAANDKRLDMFDMLRLEAFRPPAPPGREDRFNPLVTQRETLAARRLPRTPIELCAYDLLVLTRDGLSEISPSSLDAVTAWLRAGGSALIELGGPLGTSQVDFLNELMSQNDRAGHASNESDHPKLPDKWPLLTQPDGTVDFRPGPTGRPVDLWSGEYGLGRVVVTTRPLDKALDASRPDSRLISAYLWKVTQRQAERFAFGERFWQEERRADSEFIPTFWNNPLQPAEFVLENEFTAALLPESVQTIPAGHVISVLAIFLLLIAPGDYLLLGLLRRRTLTWILFPAISLGVTFYMVQMARNTVGSSDFVTSLTIVDFVDDTTIARATRIEMLFTAAEREVVADARDELFVPLVQSDESRDQRSRLMGRRYPLPPASDAAFQIGVRHEPPQYAGQIPGNYRVVRQMRKWTPQLCRRTWIGSPPGDLPAFDWSLIEPDKLFDPVSRLVMARQVMETSPEAAINILIRNGLHIDLVEEIAFPETETPAREFSALTRSLSSEPNQPDGWSYVVARVSPNGDSGLEDLRLLDASNPAECLVIVTLPVGDSFVSLRRLYRIR